MTTTARAKVIALTCLSSAIGGLATSGNEIFLALTAIVPAIWLYQPSRWGAYLSACCYYAAALWQIPHVLRAMPFEQRPRESVCFIIWLCASVLLSLPWALAWSHDRRRALMLAPLAQMLSIIPPLGLIGVACPVSAAGLVLPGAGWLGIAAVLFLPAALVVWPRTTALGLSAAISVVHLAYDGAPPAPKNWEGINTGREITEGIINRHEEIQEVLSTARQSGATVLVFPETAVAEWAHGTDLYWRDAIARLRASGKTVLIGSTVEIATPINPLHAVDFDDAIAVLSGDPGQSPPTGSGSQKRYRNVVLIRGEQSGSFDQRVPVPVGMWNPFSTSGVPLNLTGPATMELMGHRVAILICYEQLLAWPVLTSMIQKPEFIVGTANTYLLRDTSIPTLQSLYLRSWTQLFDLPTITASNR